MPTNPYEDDRADEQMLQAVDELAERTAEADRLRTELADAQVRYDTLLRQAADLQNYKRRNEADRPRLRDEGKADAVRALVVTLDDLVRALEAAQTVEGAAAVALREGVEAVRKNFEAALKTLGVEPIEAVGHPFDPHVHEALLKQPAEDAAPDTVVGELRRGYRIGDRVVRTSQVIVSA